MENLYYNGDLNYWKYQQQSWNGKQKIVETVSVKMVWKNAAELDLLRLTILFGKNAIAVWQEIQLSDIHNLSWPLKDILESTVCYVCQLLAPALARDFFPCWAKRSFLCSLRSFRQFLDSLVTLVTKKHTHKKAVISKAEYLNNRKVKDDKLIKSHSDNIHSY